MKATMVMFGLLLSLPAYASKYKSERSGSGKGSNQLVPYRQPKVIADALNARGGQRGKLAKLYKKHGRSTVDQHLVSAYGTDINIEYALLMKDEQMLSSEIDALEGLVDHYGSQVSNHALHLLAVTRPDEIRGFAKDLWFKLFKPSVPGAE